MTYNYTRNFFDENGVWLNTDLANSLVQCFIESQNEQVELRFSHMLSNIVSSVIYVFHEKDYVTVFPNEVLNLLNEKETLTDVLADIITSKDIDDAIVYCRLVQRTYRACSNTIKNIRSIKSLVEDL